MPRLTTFPFIAFWTLVAPLRVCAGHATLTGLGVSSLSMANRKLKSCLMVLQVASTGLLTTILFSGCSYPLSIKIVEASNYEMILGVDVLSKSNAVTDLGKCALKIEGSSSISLSKQELDVTESPTLNCASNAIIPPLSITYLACKRIASVSKLSIVMCIADTAGACE